jgi:hypothetical protein
MVVHFLDIGAIVDNQCLNFLFILIYNIQTNIMTMFTIKQMLFIFFFLSTDFINLIIEAIICTFSLILHYINTYRFFAQNIKISTVLSFIQDSIFFFLFVSSIVRNLHSYKSPYITTWHGCTRIYNIIIMWLLHFFKVN